MPHRSRRGSGGGGGSRSRSRSRQRSQTKRSSQRRQRSRSRASQRSQSKRRSQQRRQQREERANVREQARSASARAAQARVRARAAKPSYIEGLQAAGGLSGTQGAGAGQAARLANEYGQKGTTDARKKEISKQLKDVRSQLNIDNKKRSFDNLLKASKKNKGLVARTTDGSIITDSSGNPIMTSAGRDVFDQTRQGYRDRSEYLRQTNPELYNKMYPVAGAAMNLLPKAMEVVMPGGTMLKNIASSLKGGADKVKSGIGSIFNRFQKDQGTTGSPAGVPAINQGGGGGGGQGGTPETELPQAETSWSGIYNRLVSQGLTSEEAKQRMAELAQSGGLVTFGPIPQEFRISPGGILKPFDPSQAVIGGIPGISQPMRPGYGISIGNPGPRTGVFLDSDGDGIDDRDQRGPGMPNMSETLKTGKMINMANIAPQANTPANAMAAFNQMQPMSTQQLARPVQSGDLNIQPLGIFNNALNRFI